MAGWFIESLRPLSTCTAGECRGCLAQDRLQCHFDVGTLLRFWAFSLPPFVLGGMGIARMGPGWLVPWIAWVLVFFGLVEIRVMCSHCPHYAEPDLSSLRCWANYGMPKLWRYRPGPMSAAERSIFFGGLVLVFGYPLAFLLAGAQWLLFTLYIFFAAAMAALMATLMCNRCINFACPFNRVDAAVRQAFFACNPGVARAWRGAHSSASDSRRTERP